MKTLHYSIIVVTILLLVPMMMNNPVKAGCLGNPDWPEAPCYGCPGCAPDKEKQREEWSPYYQYKGANWMEMMKTQMIEAMKNATLEDWVTGNQSNYDVWNYYYLNNQAPFFRSSVSGLNDEKHYVPPPLQQLKTGIAAKDITCRQDLLLVIKSEDNSPACVKLDAAYLLIKRGWATSESAYPGGDAQFVSDTNSTIMPAHLPRSSGVRSSYYEPSRVINYTGFDGIYNETFLYRGMQKDYVLKPGSTGIITFEIEAVASEQQGQSYPIPLPKSLNLTNYAVFYHEITSLEDLSKYPGVTFDDNGYGHFRACSTGPAGRGTCIGGPFEGTNPIEAFVTDHPGVDVLFEPPSEVLSLGMNATSQVVTMMITADSNAPRGTYLVELPSTGSDSFLLTVGNQPYHE